MSRMLYKAPGPHQLHGVSVDYTIVEEAEAQDLLAQGWHLTPTEAHAAIQAPEPAQAAAPAAPPPESNAPPTRAELEQKARELGLKFDGRTSDKKLAEAITAALEA